MFFWMVLLTLFSSILIYTLYPRNDAVTLLDQPLAKISVNDFLTQHMAAEQAASLMTKYYNSSSNSISRKMAYVDWVKYNGSAQGYEPPFEKFDEFVPAGYIFSDERPRTKIYCVRNGTDGVNGTGSANAHLTTECGVTKGDYSTTDFLVTFGHVPEEFGSYIENLSPQALGRRLFLTSYTHDTVSTGENDQSFKGYSLKTNCGILKEDFVEYDGYTDGRLDFDPESNIFLDNTRYYTVRFPSVIPLSGGSNPKLGDLVCITRLSVTYEPDEFGKLKVVYPFYYAETSGD